MSAGSHSHDVSTCTDAQGRYRLEHIFTQGLAIAMLSATKEGYEMATTRGSGTLIPEVRLTMDQLEPQLDFTLEVARPPHVYHTQIP